MDKLAKSLLLASDGGGSEIREFLKVFLESTLLVPEKHQPQPLRITAQYPDRPFNFLAIEDSGQTRIPVFSSDELVSNWSTLPLKIRSVQAKVLLDLMPEDWWITLNPADQNSKDFSPWEIDRLRGGEIDEIISEILSEHGIQALQVRSFDSNEITGLTDKLQELFASDKNTKEIFLAVETGENIEGTLTETLLAGFRFSELDPDELNPLREKLKADLSPLLIGSMNLKILIGVGFSDLELGIFHDIPPSLRKSNKS